MIDVDYLLNVLNEKMEQLKLELELKM